MSVYTGCFDQERWFQVFKDGEPFSPKRSLKVRNHSPDGFAWNYSGSGPAQLALAILLEETDQATAERLYQEYKTQFIALLPVDENWSLTSEQVKVWLNKRGC